MRHDPQIAALIARYSPAIAKDLAFARNKVASLFPHGYELVYDNYNALVFGFSPTSRTSDAIVSIVGYPKWVTLFFLKGAGLEDPERLLVGSGNTVRSVRLQPVTVLEGVPVLELLTQAIAPYAPVFAAAPKLSTTIRFISEKQRPRRLPSEVAAARNTKPRRADGLGEA